MTNRRRDRMWLWAAPLLAAVNTVILIRMLFNSVLFYEMFLGWALAAIFNLSGLAIRMAAVGKNVRKFFTFSFVLGPVNAVAFLGFVFLAILNVDLNVKIFVCSVFITYVTLMVFDILVLRSMALKI